MAQRKSPKSGGRSTASANDYELDAKHIMASLSRVKDPMLRYLVCMMVDRLTQQIATLETGSGARSRSAGNREVN